MRESMVQWSTHSDSPSLEGYVVYAQVLLDDERYIVT